MQLQERRLTEIIPYENNPRRNNDAVKAVAESIKQCGYVSPIIIDENNVILAGHTRYKALALLGYEKCKVIVAEGLDEDQKKKYRILDNKTNELAGWDFELLAKELADLDFNGFDFGFNTADEIDIDDLFQDHTPKEPKSKVIECPFCHEKFEI